MELWTDNKKQSEVFVFLFLHLRSNKRYWDLEVNIMSKASAKTLGWCEERVLEQLGKFKFEVFTKTLLKE